MPEPTFHINFDERDMPELLQIKNYYFLKNKRDSLKVSAHLPAGSQELNAVVKSILDTTNNLTLYLSSRIAKAEKDGKGWELRLSNGKKIKTEVLVDATNDLNLSSLLKIDRNKTVAVPSTNPFDSRTFRTSLAFGNVKTSSGKTSLTLLPAGYLLPAGHENVIVVPGGNAKFNFDPMASGKAAGIMAAYCAFFKTTTKAVNSRIAQGELIAFRSVLIPLSDIPETHPNKDAIQRLVLTGLLKPKLDPEGIAFRFDTSGTVTTEELKQPMRELFSRSQIWFADNQKEIITVEDAISLLQFTANRADELITEIRDGWAKSFSFNGVYDPKKPISRLELGVLLERYLQPFNVKTDYQGNFLK